MFPTMTTDRPERTRPVGPVAGGGLGQILGPGGSRIKLFYLFLLTVGQTKLECCTLQC